MNEERASLTAALDLNRLAEFVELADMLVNLWSSARLAAERGDEAVIRLNCKQAQIVARQAFDLARALGSAEADA
jgi:hypothetical protein